MGMFVVIGTTTADLFIHNPEPFTHKGAAGASVGSQDEEADVPAFPVAAKISVGAGDSFNVGFLDGVQQGGPGERALRFGNAVAALVVSSPRGVLDSPTLAEIEALVDGHS